MFSWLFGGSGNAGNDNNNNDNNNNGAASTNVVNTGGVMGANDISTVGSVAGNVELDLSQADPRLDPTVFERIAKAASARLVLV